MLLFFNFVKLCKSIQHCEFVIVKNVKFESLSSFIFYLFINQFHKNMTADNTRTGLTRLAKHSQWPQ